MTPQTMRLLEALLTNPTREWYGLELMELAGLQSGTVYPILHRLEAEGWLASTHERIDPRQEGRPRRRLYRLTGQGVMNAHVVPGQTEPPIGPRVRSALLPRGSSA